MLFEIKNEVKRLGLESQVGFWGDIEDPQIFLSHANVLLLPSLVEGLPGVILEAMYNKVPVVAYDVGGVSEVITNDVTGKLVKFDDEENFSNAVLEFKNNTDLKNSIVQNAFALINKDFMNRDLKESFLKSYKELYNGIMCSRFKS